MGLAIVIAAVLVIVAVLGGLLLEPFLLLVLIGALLALAVGVGRRARRTD